MFSFLYYPAGVLLTLAILLIVTRFWKKKAIKYAANSPSPLDDKYIPVAFKILRYILFYLAGILILGHFKINVNVLGAIAGMFGLALGMGSKDVIKDLWGSVKLFITRPFKIGQDVKFKSAGEEGTVLDITFFYVILDNKKGGKIYLDVNKAVTSTIEIP